MKYSNEFNLEVICRLLISKGIISEEEIKDMQKQLEKEMPSFMIYK